MDTNDEFPDKKRIPCFRSYLPDALRLRFEDKLPSGPSLSVQVSVIPQYIRFSAIYCIRYRMAIARFSFISSLDAILYANRKKELTEPQISEAHGEKNGEPATAVNLRSV